MDDTKRLKLIVEAIRYCQRVSKMGMPPSCYAKALREPVYFLWECRGDGTKDQRPRYRSRAAIGVQRGKGSLIYDHAVPFRYLQAKLLSLGKPTRLTLARTLNEYGVVVLITKAEDRRLSKAGLRSKMPEDWDGVDALARYRAVGIEVTENVTVAATRRTPSVTR